MVDERVLRRFDLLLSVVAGWALLTLVVASYALMLFDVAIGVLALATVALFAVVGVHSYLRSTSGDPEVRLDPR
jgi:hypothetical protein